MNGNFISLTTNKQCQRNLDILLCGQWNISGFGSELKTSFLVFLKAFIMCIDYSMDIHYALLKTTNEFFGKVSDLITCLLSSLNAIHYRTTKQAILLKESIGFNYILIQMYLHNFWCQRKTKLIQLLLCNGYINYRTFTQ